MEQQVETQTQCFTIRTILSELSKNLTKFKDCKISVSGWIRTIRVQSAMLAFVKLYDGSCQEELQIVFHTDNQSEKDNFKDLFSKGTTGVSLQVYGKIVPSPAKGQLVELVADSVKILGEVNPDEYPIAKTKLSLEHLRKYQHLRARTSTFQAVFRIRSALTHATYQFFGEEKNFTYVEMPQITTSECEGGGEQLYLTSLLKDEKEVKIDYTKDYFQKKVFLTVSGQLHLEAFACSMGNVYTNTLATRGEKSRTNKHLSQFNMIEWEMPFCTLKDNMQLAEDYIKYCIKYILDNCPIELETLSKFHTEDLLSILKKYLAGPFIKTTHREAVERMLLDQKEGKVKFEKTPAFDQDVSSEHEKYIVDIIHGGKPVFLQFFPECVKSFYMPQIEKGNDSLDRVDCYDLLVPGIGEIIGGSQRISDYSILLSKMKKLSMNIEPLEWYLDLRKFGTVPHGGAGLGFERLVRLCTGIENIRDVVPFPRAYQECEF